VSTDIEFYQRLSKHLPEEAAKLIAEKMQTESPVATRDDVHRVELAIEKLRSSTSRWNLMFFVPLWIGVYATLAAIVLRGSP
jgi:hypothetical protein